MVPSSGTLVKRELTSKEHKISLLFVRLCPVYKAERVLDCKLIFGDRMQNLNKKRRENVIICVHGGDDCAKRATGFVNLWKTVKYIRGRTARHYLLKCVGANDSVSFDTSEV